MTLIARVDEPLVRFEEHFADNGGELIGLKHRQAAEQSEETKSHRKRFPLGAESLNDEIHRAALNPAGVILAAVHDG